MTEGKGMDKDLMLIAAPLAAELARAKIATGIEPTDPIMLRNCFLAAYRAADAAGHVIEADRAKRSLPPSPLISATPTILPIDVN
ncbi:hypothetical protein [Xylophilus sp. GOD-11R]|uniref:hypothetical protein n=1 Tax=Xylophilus sp. GOD-11R TaxID=3089814 RepID=UPI00298CA277|nr:hypothetical protein [Xylophilus sp. GOD-11R]WPB59041.1 hypothetical protein R9X41_10525 [Xylophilus sp. GOD-11R]